MILAVDFTTIIYILAKTIHKCQANFQYFFYFFKKFFNSTSFYTHFATLRHFRHPQKTVIQRALCPHTASRGRVTRLALFCEYMRGSTQRGLKARLIGVAIATDCAACR